MKHRCLLFLSAVITILSLFVSLSLTISSSDVLSDTESLTDGENVDRNHQTVVFCGGEHPRFWRTGCCEGAGSCVNECQLDYSC